jgi:hypothetical protein
MADVRSAGAVWLGVEDAPGEAATPREAGEAPAGEGVGRSVGTGFTGVVDSLDPGTAGGDTGVRGAGETDAAAGGDGTFAAKGAVGDCGLLVVSGLGGVTTAGLTGGGTLTGGGIGEGVSREGSLGGGAACGVVFWGEGSMGCGLPGGSCTPGVVEVAGDGGMDGVPLTGGLLGTGALEEDFGTPALVLSGGGCVEVTAGVELAG